MAGFGFTEEQEMFRTEVRNFAKKEIAPGAKERAKLDSIPPGIIKKLADMGLLALNVPAEYGGQPTDWVTVGIAIEELGRAEFAIVAPVIYSILASTILQEGPEEIRREWIPSLVRGEKIICAFLLTEPDCGSDAAAMKTRAVRDGDHYLISGEKTPITMGMQAEGGIIYAKTDPNAGIKGVSCFLMPFDLPGISRSLIPHMGWKPMGAASVIMDEVRIPVKNRIGEEGKGFHIVMKRFDFTRALIGCWVVGTAATCLEEAISYAQQRTAFGSPIAKFEGISFKLAEAATMIEAARWLCYRTLWLADQGLPHTKESAMCKWFCPQVAVRVAHDALLIHGHMAYSEEYPIEQRLRDLIGTEMADGTAEIMKIIIARELMGKEFIL